MSDQETTIHELKKRMAQFVRERDWEQFHSPKNLSMSIAIEAAELMEHFQWLTIEQSKSLDEAALQDIREELADIVIYALSLSNILDVDLARAISDKMEKNIRKYPKEKVRGKAHKYTYYRDDNGDE